MANTKFREDVQDNTFFWFVFFFPLLAVRKVGSWSVLRDYSWWLLRNQYIESGLYPY